MEMAQHGLGDTITFLITVENTGSTALNGIVRQRYLQRLEWKCLSINHRTIVCQRKSWLC